MKTTIRHILSTLAFATISTTAQAQIGYQVSLLNTATGEPRANVTVNAQVTITDSQNNTIYSGSQQATTNDFGVLSLAVGDANTFANADTGKMPFFISVSVDGTLIGRSQILNVPVAEVANRVKSSFTKEDLVGTWTGEDYNTKYTLTFNADNTMTRYYIREWANGEIDRETKEYFYEIDGNWIITYSATKDEYIRDQQRSEIRWYKSMLHDSYSDMFLTKQ